MDKLVRRLQATLLASLAGILTVGAQPYLTFNNRPIGSPGEPLVMQTYLPDPGLDPAVFAQHRKGQTVAKYNVGQGRDVQGEDPPIDGLPAAIAVSYGPQLAYVFDPVECRILYAWQGGFLDFTPYWGDTETGSRVGNDYVPRLVGTLFHQASGPHPLSIGGKRASELGPPEYLGYTLEKGVPRFSFRLGGHVLRLLVRPLETEFSFVAEWSSEPPVKLAWSENDLKAKGEGTLELKTLGKPLAQHQGYKANVDVSIPTVAAGAALFNNYGCAACHSIDGSKGHGPSVGGIAGTLRALEGTEKPAMADAAYLLESIIEPNAKISKGYPPNYMPPFKLPGKELESLVLYIQSLATQPE
jgi:mono/diheme cytochrome c family protein